MLLPIGPKRLFLFDRQIGGDKKQMPLSLWNINPVVVGVVGAGSSGLRGLLGVLVSGAHQEVQRGRADVLEKRGQRANNRR